VDGAGKGLGEEVGQVEAAGEMSDSELALADAVAEPVEPHVDTLGFLLFDGIVGEANGEFVVTEDGCRWLTVAEGDGDVA